MLTSDFLQIRVWASHIIILLPVGLLRLELLDDVVWESMELNVELIVDLLDAASVLVLKSVENVGGGNDDALSVVFKISIVINARVGQNLVLSYYILGPIRHN